MQGTQPKLDIVFALVDSVTAAADRFRELGFTVGEGGLDLGSGSRCATIGFSDGSLLQFVERPAGVRARRRRRRWLSRRGAGRARKRGTPAILRRTVINCERMKPGLMDFAVRSPGGDVSDAFGVLACRRRFRVPFVHQPGKRPGRKQTTDTDLRIPIDQPRSLPIVRNESAALPIDDRLCDHRNEIQGIFRVEIGVCGIEETLSTYEKLTGVAPESYDNAIEERHVFRLCGFSIEIVPVDTALEEGVREIGLRAGFRGHYAVFDAHRCHGIEMHVRYVEPDNTAETTTETGQTTPVSTSERNEQHSESTSSGIP